MAEPASTSTVGMTSLFGFSAIGVLSSAHPTAIWGAFIGAMIYIIARPEHNPIKKVLCLLVAWAFGYYIALEAISRGLAQTEGAVSVIAAIFCLPVVFTVLTKIENGDVWKLLKRLLGGGRGNDT